MEHGTLIITVSGVVDGTVYGKLTNQAVAYIGEETFKSNTVSIYANEFQDIKVTKIWNDDNNQRNSRVNIILWVKGYGSSGSGSEYFSASYQLPTEALTSDTFTYTFSNCPSYSDTGITLSYECSESNCPSTYTRELAGTASTGFKITNSYDVDKITWTMTVEWDDGSNEEGIRKAFTWYMNASAGEYSWIPLYTYSYTYLYLDSYSWDGSWGDATYHRLRLNLVDNGRRA